MIKLPLPTRTKAPGPASRTSRSTRSSARSCKSASSSRASAGFIVRGDPDGFDLVNGFRWGFGAAIPYAQSLRLTAELHGEFYLDDAVVIAEESRILGEFIVPARFRAGWPGQRDHRPDLAKPQRGFRGAGAELEHAARRPQRLRQLRGRKRATRSASSSASAITRASAVCGTSTSSAAATAGGAAEPAADGPSALRAVHGRNRPHVHGHGRRGGSRRRHADLPVERAGGQLVAIAPTGRRRGPRRCRKARCP